MGCTGSRPPQNPSFIGIRTSTNAALRVRCAERNNDEFDKNSPVKVVVFDLDETLTLSTFMRPDLTFPSDMHQKYIRYNFQSPFVEDDRVPKLVAMLDSLSRGKQGEQRALTVLTKNVAGVKAVLGLLQMAGLAHFFSAIWVMPFSAYDQSGAFYNGEEWVYFSPPRGKVNEDHKADVLTRISKNPAAYFPQMQNGQLQFLQQLGLEQLVLVDDQRANFQSLHTGAKVLRYCKVPRYDAVYRNFGLIRDMGGIGAHSETDYDALVRFVEDPWMCIDTMQVRCQQRDMDDDKKKLPVVLVAFDFDETLTMATFMPNDPECATRLGWTPNDSASNDWNKADLVTYNFETPWVKGNRIAKMKAALEAIRQREDGGPKRTLVVLTRNDSGPIAVLNLLLLAGLAEHFAAIWSIPSRDDVSNGAYQDNGVWKLFDPPVDKVYDHKADVLHNVADNPGAWFPNLAKLNNKGLSNCLADQFVLVDDERSNFRSNSQEQAKVMRYCKVARYDDTYRDCGLLNQSGGIGAHSDEDFSALKAFVEAPWEYPYEQSPESYPPPCNQDALQRSEGTTEEEKKAPRIRPWLDRFAVSI